MCLMAEISAQSSVSLLQSLSVHLDPRSLLGLTTLVTAFLNSSKRGSYVWYCSWSPGTPSSDRDVMIPDKEECQHALDLYSLWGEIRALDSSGGFRGGKGGANAPPFGG